MSSRHIRVVVPCRSFRVVDGLDDIVVVATRAVKNPIVAEVAAVGRVRIVESIVVIIKGVGWKRTVISVGVVG